MNFIVQLHGTRPDWPENLTEHEERVMQEHYSWLVNLMHERRMLLAGPTDGLYGLIVLEVEHEEEARQLMEREPSVVAGVHAYTLHPFVASLLYGRDTLPETESDTRIEKSALVPASVDAVWECWTTSEGVQSFLVERAIIELRVGGKYELHFAPDAPWGERGSEGCRVLTYVPRRLLSFTWNAPPVIPELRFVNTRVVVELEPSGDDATEVRLTHLGFGMGGEWPKVVEYFDRAWGNVLTALVNRFA
jgi:uncharacterized protein YndB with AHSA1/START domain/uncharacterized protein YciI